MTISGEKPTLESALNALQYQAGSDIHPGARTALSMQNKAHYLELNTKKVTLIGSDEARLPFWFTNYDWKVTIAYHQVSILPPDMGLTEIHQNSFKIKISDPIRALMECLHLATDEASLTESFEIMEGHNNLVPAKVQLLLAHCSSVKVKRLFLYFAEIAGRWWLNHLQTDKISLGTGKRSLIEKGAYIAKYQITVPKELA